MYRVTSLEKSFNQINFEEKQLKVRLDEMLFYLENSSTSNNG
jgi:hypothetical protein